jgi:hypothetical protein
MVYSSKAKIDILNKSAAFSYLRILYFIPDLVYYTNNQLFKYCGYLKYTDILQVSSNFYIVNINNFAGIYFLVMYP